MTFVFMKRSDERKFWIIVALVSGLFAELKNQIGLRRLRLRRMKFVREQFWLAATVQNIKRLVRFLSQPAAPLPQQLETRKEPTSPRHHTATEPCDRTLFQQARLISTIDALVACYPNRMLALIDLYWKTVVISVWRTQLWLPSRWECQDRHPSMMLGKLHSEILPLPSPATPRKPDPVAIAPMGRWDR